MSETETDKAAKEKAATDKAATDKAAKSGVAGKLGEFDDVSKQIRTLEANKKSNNDKITKTEGKMETIISGECFPFTLKPGTITVKEEGENGKMLCFLDSDNPTEPIVVAVNHSDLFKGKTNRISLTGITDYPTSFLHQIIRKAQEYPSDKDTTTKKIGVLKHVQDKIKEQEKIRSELKLKDSLLKQLEQEKESFVKKLMENEMDKFEILLGVTDFDTVIAPADLGGEGRSASEIVTKIANINIVEDGSKCLNIAKISAWNMVKSSAMRSVPDVDVIKAIEATITLGVLECLPQLLIKKEPAERDALLGKFDGNSGDKIFIGITHVRVIGVMADANAAPASNPFYKRIVTLLAAAVTPAAAKKALDEFSVVTEEMLVFPVLKEQNGEFSGELKVNGEDGGVYTQTFVKKKTGSGSDELIIVVNGKDPASDYTNREMTVTDKTDLALETLKTRLNTVTTNYNEQSGSDSSTEVGLETALEEQNIFSNVIATAIAMGLSVEKLAPMIYDGFEKLPGEKGKQPDSARLAEILGKKLTMNYTSDELDQKSLKALKELLDDEDPSIIKGMRIKKIEETLKANEDFKAVLENDAKNFKIIAGGTAAAGGMNSQAVKAMLKGIFKCPGENPDGNEMRKEFPSDEQGERQMYVFLEDLVGDFNDEILMTDDYKDHIRQNLQKTVKDPRLLEVRTLIASKESEISIKNAEYELKSQEHDAAAGADKPPLRKQMATISKGIEEIKKQKSKLDEEIKTITKKSDTDLAKSETDMVKRLGAAFESYGKWVKNQSVGQQSSGKEIREQIKTGIDTALSKIGIVHGETAAAEAAGGGRYLSGKRFYLGGLGEEKIKELTEASTTYCVTKIHKTEEEKKLTKLGEKRSKLEGEMTQEGPKGFFDSNILRIKSIAMSSIKGELERLGIGYVFGIMESPQIKGARSTEDNIATLGPPDRSEDLEKIFAAMKMKKPPYEKGHEIIFNSWLQGKQKGIEEKKAKKTKEKDDKNTSSPSATTTASGTSVDSGTSTGDIDLSGVSGFASSAFDKLSGLISSVDTSNTSGEVLKQTGKDLNFPDAKKEPDAYKPKDHKPSDLTTVTRQELDDLRTAEETLKKQIEMDRGIMKQYKQSIEEDITKHYDVLKRKEEELLSTKTHVMREQEKLTAHYIGMLENRERIILEQERVLEKKRQKDLDEIQELQVEIQKEFVKELEKERKYQTKHRKKQMREQRKILHEKLKDYKGDNLHLRKLLKKYQDEYPELERGGVRTHRKKRITEKNKEKVINKSFMNAFVH